MGTGTSAHKVKVKTFNGNYVVFGLDENTAMLSMWSIDGPSITGDIYFTPVTTFRDVKDFDIVLNESTNTVFVYYLKEEDDNLFLAHIWQGDKNQWEIAFENSVAFDSSKRRWLQSISCFIDNTKTGSFCAINTFGTKIYVLDIAFPPNNRLLTMDEQLELGIMKFEAYSKLGGWDGDELFITDKFVVQKAWHMSGGG